jgi:hypothetical protein
MDYSGYALPAPIRCITKWWQSVTMNVCNKGYNLGVHVRSWGLQAALNHWYLPNKLHCVCHGRLTSERTLSHISITCDIVPSHVGRSSSSGIWCPEARWVLPEILKHEVHWRCQDLHARWHKVTSQLVRIFSSTVVRDSDHTSHLCSACSGHLKYW